MQRRHDRPPNTAWQAFLQAYREGRFFEAHEVLEHAWLRRKSDFYRGMIILAAAFVKRDRQELEGVRRNLLKARRYLAPYQPAYLGIDVREVVRRIEATLATVTKAQARGETSTDGIAVIPLRFDPSLIRGVEPEREEEA